MTSLALYLRYEYVEKDCLELTCFVSDVTISGTKLVKFDIVVTIILIIGSLNHFFRILILAYRYQWFGFQGKLDQTRLRYLREHRRLMSSNFGRA